MIDPATVQLPSTSVNTEMTDQQLMSITDPTSVQLPSTSVNTEMTHWCPPLIQPQSSYRRRL